MASDQTMNAIIGGVVTIVLSFTGFSPLLGGAVAGYLNQRDGVRVGALAGVVALVPLLPLLFIVGGFLGIFSLAGGMGPGSMGGMGLIGLFFGLFAFAFFSAVVVGMSALGGYLGEYLYAEDVL
ncbi:DUF5518 domain-containing protein [Halorientalis halophila]|jgi:hypothetical protein|uniref:DUF5518 domain-containing protein n=1 Tax=Halorientalis halophila TaxID=3108499 RepID=UPI00300BE222